MESRSIALQSQIDGGWAHDNGLTMPKNKSPARPDLQQVELRGAHRRPTNSDPDTQTEELGVVVEDLTGPP